MKIIDLNKTYFISKMSVNYAGKLNEECFSSRKDLAPFEPGYA